MYPYKQAEANWSAGRWLLYLLVCMGDLVLLFHQTRGPKWLHALVFCAGLLLVQRTTAIATPKLNLDRWPHILVLGLLIALFLLIAWACWGSYLELWAIPCLLLLLSGFLAAVEVRWRSSSRG